MGNDILIWPDEFWCFREEFGPTFMRENDYRELQAGSSEWATINSMPAVWAVPLR